jgi:hypothetical protein
MIQLIGMAPVTAIWNWFVLAKRNTAEISITRTASTAAMMA